MAEPENVFARTLTPNCNIIALEERVIVDFGNCVLIFDSHEEFEEYVHEQNCEHLGEQTTH